ncbi:7-cyano-7-deazaguanine synthase QueC [Natronospirillum operosum]|uniref:7-cyano-7-deazaguanine synthase n=1 Tax=Natronospirillum operosum TaxID=2759953 RepID=A0A4Z0WGZ8_9GAMM|nr:7-cyano-7-deazaguanine synthase QueC [Natronospirillum operosum]TGG93920.1 7-cyano-7-deazaguanine synthase QueC [Natronospirillum operosum]
MSSAIVLLSGGLDSATAVAIAAQRHDKVYGLSFRYGQRHSAELLAAQRVAARQNLAEHRIIDIDLAQLGGSSLTDGSLSVPETPTEGIPNTYVPARNTVFLSYGLAYAEVTGAQAIYLGINAVDYSGYPDCRPEFVAAYQNLVNVATRATVTGSTIQIEAPLIDLSKADIIRWGVELGVDYGITVSCYQADEAGTACGVCDSCRLRHQGFVDAGVEDPTPYR